MSDLTNRLSALTTPHNEICQPVLYRLGDSDGKALMSELLERNPSITVVDKILLQLKDLIKLENPERSLGEQEYSDKIALKLGATPLEEYGVWVHYPWKNQLVHMLDEEEFIRVRTIRNAYKITFEEQATLRTKKVGVIGLSVGQSVSLALAIERIAGEIRIADFDTLELSNLNRIRTGVHNLDALKTVVVAREIAELDPFIKVVCFHNGITKENIDSFFDEGGRLDLLVEECDSVAIKILARQEAKKRQLPVVMDTSDRGMLDIERFDLDPEYLILHGLVDEKVDYEFLSALKTSEEKLPYVLPIVGVNSLSVRFKASGLDIGGSITTWPQLGTDVMFGGAICANAVKRILLGELIESGRVWMDMEEKLKSKNAKVDINYKFEESLAQESIQSIVSNVQIDSSFELPLDLLNAAIAAATKAPSPGNNQKWKWYYTKGNLLLFIDKKFEYSFGDNKNLTALIACGCALENLSLFLESKHIKCQIELNNEKDLFPLMASIKFQKTERIGTQNLELSQFIYHRHTNRLNDSIAKISQSQLNELQLSVNSAECKLHFIEERDSIVEISKLICKGDRLRLMNPQGHQEFYKKEIRWTKEESEKHRDGLDLSLMNLTASDYAGLEIAQDLKAIEFAKSYGGGLAFEKISEKCFKQDCILGALTIDNYSEMALINAGRQLERLWLQATKMEIGLYPMTVLPVLFSFIKYNANKFISDVEMESIVELKNRYCALDKDLNKRELAFYFRLNITKAPEGRSLRKSLNDILIIE